MSKNKRKGYVKNRQKSEGGAMEELKKELAKEASESRISTSYVRKPAALRRYEKYSRMGD